MSRFLKLFAPSVGGVAVVLGSAYILADQFVVDMPAPARGEIVTAANASGDTAPAPAANASAAAAAAPEAPVQMAMASGDPATGSDFGLGRVALPEEVTAWDIDIRPDGAGLPDGRGDVLTGEEVYTENCAMCHGDFGEAVDRWPVLAGGQGTLDSDDPVKTIGSYWPYLSTVWDYVHRAMPFGNAQSLSDDEVYAITAYILYLNDLVDEDFELSRENFTEQHLPNENGFFDDDRPVVELTRFSGEPCMENCKESVEITARARVIDVTPDTEGDDGASDEAAGSEATQPAPADAGSEAQVETASVEAPEADAGGAGAGGPDPALVAAGEKVFRKCKACHQVGEGAKNRSGPQLNGIVGRPFGAVEGFRYSDAMKAAAEGGAVWTEETLAAFLENPKKYLKGTKMSFAGLKSAEDIAAVTAYLEANSVQ